MGTTMQDQATLWNVSPERIKKFERLKVEASQIKYFLGFNDELLDQFIEAGLFADELVRVALTHCNAHYMKAYTRLRKDHRMTQMEILALKNPSDFLLGLEEGLSRSVLIRADKREIPVQSLIDGVKAGIPLEHMFEITELQRTVSLLSYIGARKAGYSHKHLVEVLRLADPGESNFDLVHYQKVRLSGIEHGKVIRMLEALRGEPAQQALYVEYVTSRPGLKHDKAGALASRNLSLDEYWDLHQDLSYLKILFGLDHGLSVRLLRECIDFLNNNSRILFKEVVQYCSITGYLMGVNDYIKLINAKHQYEQIKEAYDHGISMPDYGRLRADSIDLSHEEVMMLAPYKTKVATYIGFREQGMSHSDTINLLSQ